MSPELNLILTSLFPLGIALLALHLIVKMEKERERKWLLQMLSQDLNKIKKGSVKYLNTETTQKPRRLRKADFTLPHWDVIQSSPHMKRFKKDPILKEMMVTFKEWEKITNYL